MDAYFITLNKVVIEKVKCKLGVKGDEGIS